MILGLDVGGTHTDTVLIGPEGLAAEAKVATDRDDLFQTILNGLEQVMSGVSTEQIQRVVLSTTLATNLVIQQKLPAVGMVVAGGPGLDPAWFKNNEDYHVIYGALDHRGRE
ncbi:MAG: hydantoinase/oxoprolinase N-terminal domain-containing protein, partial [Desulfosarcinaceae bacterium]